MNRFARFVAFAGVLSLPLSARADGDDIILLTNGGRLRGTIIEDNPQKGTTIKLGDGTLHKVRASEIKEIRFADALATKKDAPPPTRTEELGAPLPMRQRARDTSRDLLAVDLAEAKQKRSSAAVTMGIGFGLGASFLIGGGVWFGNANSNQRVAPIIFLVGGGAEILLGIIGAAFYGHYDSRVTELERQLTVGWMRPATEEPRLLPIGGPSSAGALPFPSATYVGSWSIPF